MVFCFVCQNFAIYANYLIETKINFKLYWTSATQIEYLMENEKKI